MVVTSISKKECEGCSVRKKQVGRNRNSTRVYSIFKQFKKFGTNSARASFKRKRKPRGILLSRIHCTWTKTDRCQTRNDCKNGEMRSRSQGSHIIPLKITWTKRLHKEMMNRNGGFRFIIHSETQHRFRFWATNVSEK